MTRALAVLITIALAGARCAGRESLAGELDCASRTPKASGVAIEWVLGPDADRRALDSWCRGVGPVLVQPADATTPPDVEDVAIVTWNAHVGHGDLPHLVATLRSGALTGGTGPRHFVILLQEALRRDPRSVQSMRAGAMSARAIAGAGDAHNIAGSARALGLSVVYVPSMRNGHNRSEDRGNAIVSTLPLESPVAIELPFTRQRRVAIGATVRVRAHGATKRLHLMNVHLDPLGPARRLWLLGNPRERQMEFVLQDLERRRSTYDGVVIGGDLNAVSGGVEEAVYRTARRWSTSLGDEDDRGTHLMGRLDYLFFRLPEAWRARTMRAESKFGSDHYPVAGLIDADGAAR